MALHFFCFFNSKTDNNSGERKKQQQLYVQHLFIFFLEFDFFWFCPLDAVGGICVCRRLEIRALLSVVFCFVCFFLFPKDLKVLDIILPSFFLIHPFSSHLTQKIKHCDNGERERDVVFDHIYQPAVGSTRRQRGRPTGH